MGVERYWVTRESQRRFCELPTVEKFSRNEVGARDNENEVVLTKVPYEIRNFTETKEEKLMEELSAPDLREEKEAAVGERAGMRLPTEDLSNKEDDEDTVLSVVSVKDLCRVLVSATKLGFDVRAPFSVVVVDDDDDDDDDGDDDVAANLVDLVTTVKNLVLDVKILVDIEAVRLLKTDDRKVDEVILREGGTKL